MKSADLRESFLAFFESKGHSRVPSSSLVPADDPTLLFSNAGMNQFKNVFLGSEKRDYQRATSCQKCLRISGKHNDLENVGVSPRHHTFFEMLGNFSFGDYFKAEAIEYAWEFSTAVLGFQKSRMWVTIFEEDDEAEKLWKSQTDIDPQRIVRMGEKENFWAMGDTGPCGPCSELHYYIGQDESEQSVERLIADDGSILEFWNLVFMQYNRSADGTLTPLPKPSVDTGMGFERVCALVNGKTANYEIDLLRGIIDVCEKQSGLQYDGSSYKVRDLQTDKDYARDVAMRVLADHSRAIAFLIADGVHPGSEGKDYVLRRLIRRAIRHSKALNLDAPILLHTTKKVIDLMGDHYQELKEREDTILRVADAEEQKFHETLDSGLAILQREVKQLGQEKTFPGEVAFQLHDTYGFPLDLTQDALKPYNMQVDVPAFEKAMAAQRARSREDRKAQGIEFESISVSGKKTEFLGHDALQAESKVTHAVPAKEGSAELSAGDELSLFFAATPFYAESGGQVGDTGEINIRDARLQVLDTQKVGDGYSLHYCQVAEGILPTKLKGEKAQLVVDHARRARIRLNHSATHVVHAALRKFLGDHVKQAGSRVDDRSLRFDYSHFEAVSPQQLEEVEQWVNSEIRANYRVETELMALTKAKKLGAMALFGEKYGDKVRVVRIGPNSLELCGGTHVERSGDIGFLTVEAEASISAGTRRIECFTGPGAHENLLLNRRAQSEIAALLKGDQSEFSQKIERLLHKTKLLEKELEQAKARLAGAATGSLLDRTRTSPGGIKVIAEKVDGADSNTLRSMVDRLRLKLGSGVVALACQQGEKAVLVAGVTSDLTQQVHAGTLVKEATKMSGGKGGGRPDFAQAGGVDPSLMNQTLEKVFELVS